MNISEMNISAITLEVQKLELKRGDVLALRVDMDLPSDVMERITKVLDDLTEPLGVKGVVIPKRFEFQIVKPPEEPSA